MISLLFTCVCPYEMSHAVLASEFVLFTSTNLEPQVSKIIIREVKKQKNDRYVLHAILN